MRRVRAVDLTHQQDVGDVEPRRRRRGGGGGGVWDLVGWGRAEGELRWDITFEEGFIVFKMLIYMIKLSCLIYKIISNTIKTKNEKCIQKKLCYNQNLVYCIKLNTCITYLLFNYAFLVFSSFKKCYEKTINHK